MKSNKLTEKIKIDENIKIKRQASETNERLKRLVLHKLA